MRLIPMLCLGTALLLAATMLVGCAPERMVRVIGYERVGQPKIAIDPVSGQRTRTTDWRYDDGYTTFTVEILRGGGNEARGEPPKAPPVRFED